MSKRFFYSFISLFALLLNACSSLTHGLQLNAKIVHPLKLEKDGAQHAPMEQRFLECWYFDGIVNTHLSFVLQFLVSPQSNIVRLDLYDFHAGKGGVLSDSIVGRETSVSRERCDVEMGPHWVQEKDGRYLVRFKKQNVMFEFELTPILEGFGLQAETAEHAVFWPWIVAVPRGDIHGRLTVGGKTIDVAGTGYHDHNYFPNREWRFNCRGGNWWGRLFTEHYTVLMGQLFTRHDAALFIFKDHELLQSTIEGHPIFSREEMRKLERGEFPSVVHFSAPPFFITLEARDRPSGTKEFTFSANQGQLKVTNGKGAVEKGVGINLCVRELSY